MINLPIPDATTPTGSTTTTVGQADDTETMASIEFLAVWTNAPEREPLPMPEHDGVDTTQMGILGLLSRQMIGRQVPPPELKAEPSILMDIPPEGEQVDLDVSMEELPRQPQDPDEIAKGLPAIISAPDVSLSPVATKSGSTIDQPVEDIDFTGKITSADPSDKTGKEKTRTTSLGFSIPTQSVADKGNETAQNRPTESVLSGAEGANDYATKVVMSKASAQMGEPINAASLENKDDRLKQVAAQQPVRQGKNTDFDFRTPQEPDLSIRQNQTIHEPQVGRAHNSELVQPGIKSNAYTHPVATALQYPDRPQKAELAKQPDISHQDIRTLQEAPKPLPQTVPRNQAPPEQMVLDQPKASQPNRVGPEIANPVGSIANNQFTAGVVDARATAVATPAPAPSPKRGDRKAMESAPIEAARVPGSGTVKPSPTSNQAIPVTVPMANVDTNETLPFDSNAPFEISDLQSVPSQATGLTPSHQNAAVAQPEIPRHIARQLADVARQMPERPVELTLNPHELGRVRLTFTLTDGGINVAVLAERGETMDLMRRHIETLAQEFRDMGYADVGFQFSQHGRENTDGNNTDEQPQHTAQLTPLPEIEKLPPARVSLESSNGLDLRL